MVGDLAASWEVKEGPHPEIVFTLRPGYAGMTAGPSPPRMSGLLFRPSWIPGPTRSAEATTSLVDRLEVLDPLRVRVVYKEPFSPGLSSWSIGVIPRHLLEGKNINTTPFNRKPVWYRSFPFWGVGQ